MKDGVWLSWVGDGADNEWREADRVFLFNLEKKRLKRETNCSTSVAQMQLKGGYKEDRVSLFSVLQQKDERQMDERSQLRARENSTEYKEKSFHKESG